MTLQVEFTVRDYVTQFVWYIVFVALVYWQGWLLGISIYIAAFNLTVYILKAALNLEMMGGGDEFFFFDDNKNCMNIVAFHRYSKITDLDEFRKTMITRACKFPRLKSRVTKFLGKFMFEELSDEHLMASVNRIMPVVSDVHNERQLADFMAKEQSYRLPLDDL